MDAIDGNFTGVKNNYNSTGINLTKDGSTSGSNGDVCNSFITITDSNNSSETAPSSTHAISTSSGNNFTDPIVINSDSATRGRDATDVNQTDLDLATKKKQKSTKQCEMCSVNLSKYCCPGCGVRTCSLVCINAHKSRLDCNGERNPTAFVDMTQYTECDFQNDYRFLENAERKIYSNKAVPKNRNMVASFSPYRHKTHLLMKAAQKRGVRLRSMPSYMTKHKANESFYFIKDDCIEWSIEWHFVSSNCKLYDNKVKETTVLLDAVKKFTDLSSKPELQKPLELYRKVGLHSCRFLLSMEGLPANRQRFFELKPSSSIADNIQGHSITEYPRILVLLPSVPSSEYPLLDSEDYSFMGPGFLRHMTRYHSNIKVAALLAQLLNPESEIFKPADEKRSETET